MNKLTLACGLLAATCAIPALAQSMNAEAFHQRATALQRKGAMAIFSRGEINTLMKEVQQSGERARQQRLAAVRAGGKPRYCPPEGKTNLGSSEFMQRLSTIPAAERSRIDMNEAVIRVLAGKFPCRP